jgi:predicted ATPase
MKLPASVARDRLELEFQLALGTPLVSVYGYSGHEVATTYERAGALCQQLGSDRRLVPALFGLVVNRLVSGETRTAGRLAAQCRALADRQADPVQQLLSHRAMGVVSMQLGEFPEARAEFEKVVALYDPERDRSLAAHSIIDPRATGLALLSLVLWALGYSGRARSTAREAFRCAAELEHATTTGHVWLYAGAQLSELLRDAAAARSHAEAAIRLAANHRLPTWSGHGCVLSGWALAEQENAQEGLALIRRGIKELDALGTMSHRPRYLALTAEIYAAHGDPGRALGVMAEAHELVHRTGERFWLAELHRIEGELRRKADSDLRAEDCFAAATAIAREQAAKSFELRAVTSLARLWFGQGRRGEARDLLAPVYGWFTEGIDTPDLRDAKLLLEEVD